MSFIIGGGTPHSGGVSGNNFVDNSIRVGIVQEEKEPDNTGETKYMVMVTIRGKDVPVTCTRMTRFGGIDNYEEYNPRGYKEAMDVGHNIPFASRPGDAVVVAFLDGSARYGVILGGIRHPGRDEELEANQKPAYRSKINGIEKKITEEGSLTYTYQGTEIGSDLDLYIPPKGTPLLLTGKSNTLKGGSSFGFDEDGNFNISDGDRQTVTVFRDSLTGGNIEIVSGTTTVTIAGGLNNQTVTIDTKGNIALSALKNITADGLDVNLSANKKIAINAKLGISISSKGSELLDLLTQLIDEIGNLTISSPVGPCTPIMGTPTWAKVVLIQTKIKLMMG